MRVRPTDGAPLRRDRREVRVVGFIGVPSLSGRATARKAYAVGSPELQDLGLLAQRRLSMNELGVQALKG
jgi:hypothetical protein